MADQSFEIITYVSGSYDKCLAVTLPSWLQNTSAERIVVYKDLAEIKVDSSDVRVEFRSLFRTAPESLAVCCERKIEVLIDAFIRCQSKYFVWLDVDVYAAADFKDAFSKMGSNEIGGTRMFNQTKRGKGELNAGVIFFQAEPMLLVFLADWKEMAAEFRKTGQGGQWYEQLAASRLIHSAYHGQRSYSAAALSEELYNCEDDETKKWYLKIEVNRPKLIHMKNGRWQVPEMLSRMLQLALPIKEYHESKS